MRQTVESHVQAYRSACCEAVIRPATFSDGRRFLVCSACGKVLTVEAKREPRRSS